MSTGRDDDGRSAPLARPGVVYVTSTRCMSGTCVEIGRDGPVVGVRDTKQQNLGGEQPVMWVDAPVFDVFLDEMIGAAPRGSNGEIEIETLSDGDTILRARSTGIALRFDAGEIIAFVEGVRAGEFRAAPARA